MEKQLSFSRHYFQGSFSMVPDQLHVNNLDLQYIAVPEPQTWALLLGGLGLLGLMRPAGLKGRYTRPRVSGDGLSMGHPFAPEEILERLKL